MKFLEKKIRLWIEVLFLFPGILFLILPAPLAVASDTCSVLSGQGTDNSPYRMSCPKNISEQIYYLNQALPPSSPTPISMVIDPLTVIVSDYPENASLLVVGESKLTIGGEAVLLSVGLSTLATFSLNNQGSILVKKIPSVFVDGILNLSNKIGGKLISTENMAVHAKNDLFVTVNQGLIQGKKAALQAEGPLLITSNEGRITSDNQAWLSDPLADPTTRGSFQNFAVGRSFPSPTTADISIVSNPGEISTGNGVTVYNTQGGIELKSNSGKITNEYGVGLLTASGNITISANSGTLTAGVFAILAQGSAYVTNTGGTITAGAHPTGGGVTLNGIFDGVGNAIRTVGGPKNLISVNNSGAGIIKSFSSAALRASGSVLVTNEDVSLLSGIGSAILSEDSIDIKNFGTIEATPFSYKEGPFVENFGFQKAVISSSLALDPSTKSAVTVENSGTIRGDSQRGIFSAASISLTQTSTGSLESYSDAVYADKNINLVNGTGASISSASGHAVYALGSLSLQNTGDILSETGYGVYAGLASNLSHLQGRIRGHIGIQVPSNSQVTIGGSVEGISGIALKFSDNLASSTLTMKTGAVLAGQLDLGLQSASIQPLTIDFQDAAGDYSIVLTPSQFLTPDTLQTALKVQVKPTSQAIVTPDQIIVIDEQTEHNTNSLAANGSFARSLSLAVSRVLSVPAKDFVPGSSGFASASTQNGNTGVVFSHSPELQEKEILIQNQKSIYWMRALGGSSQIEPSIFLDFYGFLLGSDRVLRNDWRLGFLLGATRSRATTDNVGYQTSNTVLLSVYSRKNLARAWFMEGLFTLGISNNDSHRTVQGIGKEDAVGHFNGYLWNPEISLGRAILIDSNLTLSSIFRMNYLGLFYAGYEETGSSLNRKVDSKVLHQLSERLELKITHLTSFPGKDEEEGETHLKSHIEAGIFSLQQLNGTAVYASLGGVPIILAPTNKPGWKYGFYGGCGIDWGFDNLSLFLNGEGSFYLSELSYSLGVNVGVGARW